MTVERIDPADQADASSPELTATPQTDGAEPAAEAMAEPAEAMAEPASTAEPQAPESTAADGTTDAEVAATTAPAEEPAGDALSAVDAAPSTGVESGTADEQAPVIETVAAGSDDDMGAAAAAESSSSAAEPAVVEAPMVAEEATVEPSAGGSAPTTDVVAGAVPAGDEAAKPAPETATVAATEPAPPAPARPAPTVFEGPEPTTMEELLSQQHTEIRSLKHGDVVEGNVVRIDKDEILVDIGAKSEGVISNRELYGRNAETQPQLNIGDVVLVYVLQPESPEGHAVLSLRRAGLERKWRAMQEQLDAGEIIEAPVIDHNKGGLIVDCGIRGFVPISQIVDFPRRPQNEQPRDAAQEIAEKLQPYVGRKLRLKILEVNRKANRLILSEKVALYEERREKRDELFSSLQVGQKVTGTVRSIAPFGVFVDLGGIDGLVHKSELSWNKVNNPEAGYRVGEEVEAEVIDINHERGRISLSIRRLQPDPWHSTVADLKVGDVIDGTVTKIVNFGAFVRVRDGLEGLIHISELSHQRVAHPGDVVHEGQTLKLKIISLEQERHRLGLSLKQAEEAPARPEPSERRERRPRTERGYDMSQAVQEPEGGIDNTLAAAFAQVRQQIEQSEAARDHAEPSDETAADQAEPAAGVVQVEDPATAGETETAVDAEASAEAATEMIHELAEPEDEAETADAPALEVGEAAPRRTTARKSKAKPSTTASPESDTAIDAAAEPTEAAADEPVADEPAAEPTEAAADEPVAAAEPTEPVADEPAAAEPTEAAADEPVAAAEPTEPVADEPAAAEPTEAAADEPVADEPVAAAEPTEAAADEPVADEPVAAAEPTEPVADEPTEPAGS